MEKHACASAANVWRGVACLDVFGRWLCNVWLYAVQPLAGAGRAQPGAIARCLCGSYISCWEQALWLEQAHQYHVPSSKRSGPQRQGAKGAYQFVPGATRCCLLCCPVCAAPKASGVPSMLLVVCQGRVLRCPQMEGYLIYCCTGAAPNQRHVLTLRWVCCAKQEARDTHVRDIQLLVRYGWLLGCEAWSCWGWGRFSWRHQDTGVHVRRGQVRRRNNQQTQQPRTAWTAISRLGCVPAR